MTNSISNVPGVATLSLPISNTRSMPCKSGVNTSNFFQTPPRTAPSISASSSLILGRSSTASVMSISSHGERSVRESGLRKRTLSDFTNASRDLKDENMNGRVGWIPDSPRPLVSTRYELARGIESSSYLGGVSRVYNSGNDYGDSSYRKRLADLSPLRSRPDLFDDDLGDALAHSIKRDENHQSATFNMHQQESGWSSFALQAVSAVAGKAWEFCKNSAAVFRGFHAGGGTRYQLKCSQESDFFFEAVDQPSLERKQTLADPKYGSTLPGQYPQQNYHSHIINDSDRINTDNSLQRPAKRYQLSNKNDSLEKNWVFVPPITSTLTTSHSTPAKRNMLITPTSKHSSVNHQTLSRSAASKSSCSSLIPRRSSIRSHPSRVSHAGSPNLKSSEKASITSPRLLDGFIPRPNTPQGCKFRKHKSLLTHENPPVVEAKYQAQHWATKMKKDERIHEESIERLDARLKAMIREGMEALSSKIDVPMEIDDDETLNNFSSNVKSW